MKVFLLELSMVLAAFTLAAPLAAVAAAAEDEDQTLAMHEGTDENQVNSLDFNDEYTRQLYQKPDHLDDPKAIKKFLRTLMSSVHNPILLKAKLIVVARSPLHEIIADHGDGMTENDAKLMQIFAMNQLNQIEVMERKLMRDQQIKAFQAQGKDSNSMNLGLQGLQEYD